MKVLAIDVGNSRIKWGWHDGARWRRRAEVATARDLKTAFARLPRCDAIVISNVAGAAAGKALRAALPPAPRARWIKSGRIQCGVRNDYRQPQRLGSDRWAALIGARRRYRGPLLVVNAGTALTADALTASGVFLGGVIVPGATLMKETLAANTAALGRRPGRIRRFPRTTGDAIASGALHALAGAVERMARLLHRHARRAPVCVVSGGAAASLAPQLNLEVRVVDNLVLEGLLTIAHDRPR
ncbi:MAG TPA: type III pantothenate kinase [Burkholderiales bacterium]|nr:type III pantothenate kinase [Burkholderiales bacterium]